MNLNEDVFKPNKDGKIAIDLGCGTNKKEGYIGVDIIALEGVDYVADFEKGLGFLKDQSIDEIYSHHVLEHIENFSFLMDELHRVLKKDGKKRIFVPHFSNPYYYSDYTHVHFFGLYTFDYFALNSGRYRRKVPQFYTNSKFEVVTRKLIFRSPFLLINVFKRAFTKFVNLHPILQEIYEENFVYLLPCTELYFELSPISKDGITAK